MTLGFFCSLPTSANQRRLKICKSSVRLLCFWPFGTISTYSHHGTKRIGQGSIC
jgi:hypothetical protein